MKRQNLFSGKTKETLISGLLKFLPSMLCVNVVETIGA